MSSKAEIAYLLFTCVIFARLTLNPEWLAFAIYRGRETPNIRILQVIRIGALVCSASALLTLIL